MAVTLKELIARHELLEEKAKEKIKIEVENLGEFVFRKITQSEFMDMVDSKVEDKDALLIYNACIEPDLKSQEFIDSFCCKLDPELIANKFLSGSEKLAIAEEILKASGLSKESNIKVIIDSQKN